MSNPSATAVGTHVQEDAVHEPLLRWLQHLVHERVGAGLSLQVEPHGRVYRLTAGDAQHIDIPIWSWGVGSSVKDCCWWDAEKEGWHTVFGEPLPAPGAATLSPTVVERTEHGFTIHYDVLGLAYWMLSRAEEVGRTDLDEHERFPASSSHAQRFGYLDRPVVDEWFDVIRQVAARVWPTMRMVERQFEMRVSHDVDCPSDYAFCAPTQLLYSLAGDLLKRRDYRALIRRTWAWFHDDRLHDTDPCNTFSWIMDVSESLGLTSAFYFVCGRTNSAHDPTYSVDRPAIRALLRAIDRRGHEIGLHPSYGTFRNPAALKSEAKRLLYVCEEEGIHLGAWGGRMHFLRWSTPTTAYALDSAGFAYDSTLGFADAPGFRCGTCIEFTALDPIERKPLSLRIRPLVVMEGTLLKEPYIALGPTPAAQEIFVNLKRRCRAVGGAFTLLWHNSMLVDEAQRQLYQAVLRA